MVDFFKGIGIDRSHFSSGTLHDAFGIAPAEGSEAKVHDSMW